MGVLFGQVEDAQAGAIGLLGEWAGFEGLINKMGSLRTDRFRPLKEMFGVDLIDELVIGRHMLMQS